MDYETINLEISSNPEYVSIIRLTTSGIANKVGFCIEDIEDIKVAVSEACTNAIKHSEDSKVKLIFTMIENGLQIEIKDKGKGYNLESIPKPDLNEPKESGLGLFIIDALMDEVEVKSENNQGTTIKMIKYLGVGI